MVKVKDSKNIIHTAILLKYFEKLKYFQHNFLFGKYLPAQNQ